MGECGWGKGTARGFVGETRQRTVSTSVAAETALGAGAIKETRLQRTGTEAFGFWLARKPAYHHIHDGAGVFAPISRCVRREAQHTDPLLENAVCCVLAEHRVIRVIPERVATRAIGVDTVGHGAHKLIEWSAHVVTTFVMSKAPSRTDVMRWRR